MDTYRDYVNCGRPISSLIENYVAHASNPDFGPENDFWAFDEFLDLPSKEPEKVWTCLLILLSKPENHSALPLFSAGPLEDVLSFHGELLIDRVKNLASQNPLFVEMLRNMYQFKMSDSIWDQVRQICQK